MRVFVVIESDPWQWVVPLVGTSIAPGVIVCQLGFGQGTALGPEATDLDAAFREGSTYDLQIEEGGEPPLSLGLGARLVKRASGPTGMQLTFALPPEPELNQWLVTRGLGVLGASSVIAPDMLS